MERVVERLKKVPGKSPLLKSIHFLLFGRAAKATEVGLGSTNCVLN
jgi:hypothetical protein